MVLSLLEEKLPFCQLTKRHNISEGSAAIGACMFQQTPISKAQYGSSKRISCGQQRRIISLATFIYFILCHCCHVIIYPKTVRLIFSSPPSSSNITFSTISSI